MGTNSAGFGTTTGGGHGFTATGRISPYFEGVQRVGAGGYTRHLCTYVPWQFPPRASRSLQSLPKSNRSW